MEPFFFDHQKLNQLAEENAEAYQASKPFPHAYFDDFLPEQVADTILSEFPSPGDEAWGIQYKDEHQLKLASRDVSRFPPTIRQVLSEFNSSAFIDFLEKLTGIQGLIPDPRFLGGGMHQIIPGGFLKLHVDFNWHKKLPLERRLNVLLYLNKDWKEEYGGHFELWDKDMTEAKVKILPSFNRMALFSTSEESYHGHPDPLACPEGMSRKSLALYYYTSPATVEQVRAETSHSTLFRARPGEDITRRNTAKRVVSQFVPPIVFTTIRKFRK